MKPAPPRFLAGITRAAVSAPSARRSFAQRRL